MEHATSNNYGRFMSIPQVMTELSIGRTTVYNLLHAGKLESVKVGKYRRITKDSFESYVEELYEQSQSS